MEAAVGQPSATGPGARTGLLAAGIALAAWGLVRGLSAAWGYALFVGAGALLALAVAAAAPLVASRSGDAAALSRWALLLARAGVGSYVLALFALAGHFGHETLQGRMEWHWILFGPAAVAALLVLDLGLYRKLVANNLPTWQRFRRFIRRDAADPDALRRTFVDDVLLQRALWKASRVRWLRHALIFWGFVGMLAVEVVAVLLREAFPAFGWGDVWRVPGHPLRLAVDFAFDLTGLLVLIGCLLALAWRVRAQGTPEQKFADTPTTLFLLLVVVTGFAVEAARIAAAPDPSHAASFVGLGLATLLPGPALAAASHIPLWVAHAAAALAFLAYVPLRRMVHTCATPMGRLMNSQSGLLAAKKRGIAAGLMRGGVAPAPTDTSPSR